MTTHTVVRLVAAGGVVVLGLLIALIVSVQDEPAGAYHCDPWEPWCYHYPTATPTPVPPTATNTPTPKPPTPTPTPRPRASLSVYPTAVNVNQSFSARAYGAVPSSLLLKLRLTGPLTSRPCDTSQSSAALSERGATAPFKVTLRGCSPGTGTVKLLTYSTNVVLASRTVIVSGPTPTPTDTPVPTPTDTPVPTPTDTPVPTPTDTPVPTPTDTPVPTPTDTPVPTPTDTPVPTPTDTPVPTPRPANTATPTNTPRPHTATPTNTPRPHTATPTNTPRPHTATPTNTPRPHTATPTNTPRPHTATPTNTPRPHTATPTPTATPLPAPGYLSSKQATRSDCDRCAYGHIKLDWPAVEGADRYEVLEERDRFPVNEWVVLRSTQVTFDDDMTGAIVRKLRNGTTYKHKVRAIVDGRDGALSPAASTTLPDLPKPIWGKQSDRVAVFRNGSMSRARLRPEPAEIVPTAMEYAKDVWNAHLGTVGADICQGHIRDCRQRVS